MAVMEWMVTQAIIENNIAKFRNIVEQDEKVFERRIGNTTVLHLASKLGNVEMVSLILELRPGMVTAENNNSETPIHEACRIGHENVVKLLMEKNQWVASKLNCENQSALFMACNYGHLNVVDFLLNHTSWLLDIVDEAACLHVAAIKGQTGSKLNNLFLVILFSNQVTHQCRIFMVVKILLSLTLTSFTFRYLFPLLSCEL